MKRKVNLKKRVLDILNSSDIAGDFSLRRSLAVKSEQPNVITVLFWDGRRYNVTVDQLPDGPKIDANTGKFIK